MFSVRYGILTHGSMSKEWMERHGLLNPKLNKKVMKPITMQPRDGIDRYFAVIANSSLSVIDETLMAKQFKRSK